MTAWTNDELSKIGSAEEVQIAGRGRDGTERKPVTIWVVRHDGKLYVRSVKGRDAAWFRGVMETQAGRIRAGRIEKEVRFAKAPPEVDKEVDAAYRAKYHRYAGPILNSVLTPEAQSTTTEALPAD